MASVIIIYLFCCPQPYFSRYSKETEMYRQAINKCIPLVLLCVLFSFGCANSTKTTAIEAKPTVVNEASNVYKGKVAGRSNKARTISITVGAGDAAKTMMVTFDETTEGLEFAKKGEAAIINWQLRGEDKFATVVKPKLAKLPPGVAEIKVDELYKLVLDHAPMTLVDARPESRYAQGHLPGAISISVPMLKKKNAEVLPQDKDKLLVFYCGGYT
ncbi:MAG: rhodanese-like domain-containing protein [Desulfuromusa sp.]|nr:rhodanese-like domain-containing protein [Desulfuromusa sp.]